MNRKGQGGMIEARKLYAICDTIYYGDIQADIRRVGRAISKAIEREFDKAGIPLYDERANEDGEICAKTDNPVKLLAFDRILSLAQGELDMQTLFGWALGDDAGQEGG